MNRTSNMHARILWNKSPDMVEQDCACANLDTSFADQLPQEHILDSQSENSSFEIIGNGHSSEWEKPALILEYSLPGEHTVLFNPQGPVSTIVLNQTASQILETFSSPITINEAIHRLPYIEQHEINRAFLLLISLGFLTSKDVIKPIVRKPTTLTAWMNTTNDCNLRCDYCYISKTQDYMQSDIGYRAIDAVFRSAKANCFSRVKIKYAGGESTLQFPLIVKLHRYALEIAEQDGLVLDGVVLSNGVGITHQMIDKLQEYKLRLALSLDGIGEVHDSQRHFFNGHGSFDHVKLSLNRLLERNLIPSITITLSKRNLHGLPELVDYVLENDLPFTINYYRDNNQSNSKVDLQFSDDEIIEAMFKACLIIEDNLPAFSLLGILTDRARLDVAHTQPCGMGNSYLVIAHDGHIAQCHMEIDNVITDINDDDPLRILNNFQYGISNPSVDDKERCQNCVWRYYCAGGCPVQTSRITGRYDVKSPNCKIYRALFPEVIRLEGLRLIEYSY